MTWPRSREIAVGKAREKHARRLFMAGTHKLITNPVGAALDGSDRTLWLSTYHKRIASWRTAIRRESPPPANVLDGLATTLNEAESVYTELLGALLRSLNEHDELARAQLRAETVASRFLALSRAESNPPRQSDELRAACSRCLEPPRTVCATRSTSSASPTERAKSWARALGASELGCRPSGGV